jgi:hypothetical protein
VTDNSLIVPDHIHVNGFSSRRRFECGLGIEEQMTLRSLDAMDISTDLATPAGVGSYATAVGRRP